MLIKLRQQLKAHPKTSHSRTPNLRSRNFISNFLRRQRARKTSSYLRAALGFTQWLKAPKIAGRTAFRTECFITGRSRGTSKRFTVARTKIKELSNTAKLFGVRKSSW